MLPFLFTNPFDDVVEKATSENLPRGEEDIVQNLDICDKIRSKEVPAKAAIQSLKRRINHKNPNVQLLALKLTDLCVKNGGHHFVVEVASREFVDNMVSIVRSYPTTNAQVREKILALLQSWALAFKGKSDLSYMTETYDNLKREGLAFPPVEKSSISSIMIDTKTDVRVCDSCHYKITNKVAGSGSTSPNPKRASAQSPTSAFGAAANADHRKEDDDLEKAIAASLAESSRSRQSSRPKPRAASTTPTPKVVDEEEDPDLAAAIAASLAELKVSEQQREQRSSGRAVAGQEFGPFDVSSPPADPNQLSRVEIDNLKMFVELVERTEADVSVRGIGVIHNSQISLMALQPKLLWSCDDAVNKYRLALELNEKVSAATQMYDRMLQERLNAASAGAYGGSLHRGYSTAGMPPPQQGYYVPPTDPSQGYYAPQPVDPSQQPVPQQYGYQTQTSPNPAADYGYQYNPTNGQPPAQQPGVQQPQQMPPQQPPQQYAPAPAPYDPNTMPASHPSADPSMAPGAYQPPAAYAAQPQQQQAPPQAQQAPPASPGQQYTYGQVPPVSQGLYDPAMMAAGPGGLAQPQGQQPYVPPVQQQVPFGGYGQPQQQQPYGVQAPPPEPVTEALLIDL
ncbi:Vacuolar protein-sorting-associated protein 27 [Irineochytrium annulatum]|nr:Vacuolar protein-sorting-associated protein 27 [Irineochytrium annulatum]